MTSQSTEPLIAILLCTFQGEKYIRQQLDSISDQIHKNFVLWISDDGSTDNTIAIIRDYQYRWGKEKIRILQGPCNGAVANFMSLICNEKIIADYYAYADQDDLWDPTKLVNAISILNNNLENIPSLYCSRARLINTHGKNIGMTPLFKKPPHFKNALVQNIAGGNTMVLNHKAIHIIRKAGQTNVTCHDWWSYLLISGVGGKIFYDPQPSISYRQHKTNEIGANVDWYSRIQRMWALSQGRFKHWNSINENALKNSGNLLTKENATTFEFFINARNNNSSYTGKINNLICSGVYRQNMSSNISLFIATLVGKI